MSTLPLPLPTPDAAANYQLCHSGQGKSVHLIGADQNGESFPFCAQSADIHNRPNRFAVWTATTRPTCKRCISRAVKAGMISSAAIDPVGPREAYLPEPGPWGSTDDDEIEVDMPECYLDVEVVKVPEPTPAEDTVSVKVRKPTTASAVLELMADGISRSIPQIAEDIGKPVPTVRAVMLYGASKAFFVHTTTTVRAKMWVLA